MYCVEPHFVLAKSAMEWSLQNVVDQGDSLHVVTILPPVVYAAAPGDELCLIIHSASSCMLAL